MNHLPSKSLQEIYASVDSFGKGLMTYLVNLLEEILLVSDVLKEKLLYLHS